MRRQVTYKYLIKQEYRPPGPGVGLNNTQTTIISLIPKCDQKCNSLCNISTRLKNTDEQESDHLSQLQLYGKYEDK